MFADDAIIYGPVSQSDDAVRLQRDLKERLQRDLKEIAAWSKK